MTPEQLKKQGEHGEADDDPAEGFSGDGAEQDEADADEDDE